MNATTNHINTYESHAVRGARFEFLFGCGYAALGMVSAELYNLKELLPVGKEQLFARIIWYDPERLPQDLNPSVLDRFEEAKAGPRTGAAPSDVN